MDDEIKEKYPPRKPEDMIDITKVLIGISSDGVSKDWVMLEKTDKPNLYKDILTESEYIIKDDGTVIISRMSPDALYKDEPVREMKSFICAKTIREILEETSKFFYSLELSGYKEEIEKLRKLNKKILDLYKNIDNGEPINVSVGDLENYFKYLFNMYTYAFGNPIDEDLSVECYDIKQRSLFDLVDINDVCLATIKRKDENTPIVLEKANKSFSLKDRKIEIYRDTLYDSYYYVLENGEMYTSSSALIKRSKALSDSEKEYFIDIFSLEDAINLTLERMNPEEKELDSDLVYGLKHFSLSSKLKGKKLSFPIIELLDNETLLLNMYKKALNNGEALINPNNILGDLSTISDIVENMAYTLKK